MPPETETPAPYTMREELNALARFARQIQRLSPAGRRWLESVLVSLDNADG